jgi:hypothetical protein
LRDVRDGRIIAGFNGAIKYNCAFTTSDNNEWFAIGDDEGEIDIWKLPQ